jgi:TonB family protein
MSEDRHSPPETARVAADVLSESTNLDSLLTAILGDEPVPVSERDPEPEPDAVAAAEEVPQASEHEAASWSPESEPEDAVPLGDSLAQFQSESQRETDAVSDVNRSDDSAQSPSFDDLAALRNRLQHPRETASPGTPSADAPRLIGLQRGATLVPRSNHRSSPNFVIVDEHLTGMPDARGAGEMLLADEHGAADETQDQVESLRPDGGLAQLRRSKRFALILVGVGVVVSSALITLNAIPRVVKGGEESPAVAVSDSDTALPPTAVAAAPSPEVAGDVAPVIRPTRASAPVAASAVDRRRAMPAVRPSSSGSQPGASAGAPTPPPEGTLDVAPNDLPPTSPRPEMASLSGGEPAQSEAETPGADTSVASTPPTPAMGPVVRAAADPSASPRAAGTPLVEPPAPATSSDSPRSTRTPSRTPPRLIQGGTPEYSNVLRAARISGVVDVQVTIDETGRVTQAVAVSGPRPLRDAAERAVRTWRYDPATVDGVRASAQATVTFHFERK